ncbi:DeoR/GlpR family DNA-binding transcription regulator [Brachybacterium sp. Marseille-Q7125]|uniref:DeoR/GlpR family DNA-binding transcription regulator n=1 Tax=Brachybacterium sp. Marseille-Q7125 TaxID=2932815 RepID=UPI001FF260B4|nr:DeoR/GlpR family DNA-binding transcription regulator [Brachybacterium sp. Marseille-Q7125]
MAKPGAQRLSASERAEAITTELQRAGFASTTVLSRKLGVSDMTIRRDVRRLAEKGELRMVHGGVSLPHGLLRTATYAGRAEEEADSKRAIAEAAAGLLRPGDSVVIDSGTTCFAVSTVLPRSFRGTVITHSVPVLQQMLTNTSATVLCLGGELLAESQVLIGPRTTAAAKEITSDVLLLGANSVDTSGVYLMGDREHLVKRAFLEGASKVVLLADRSKLTRSAPVRLAGLKEIDVMVTTGPVPDALIEACTAHEVQVVEVRAQA